VALAVLETPETSQETASNTDRFWLAERARLQVGDEFEALGNRREAAPHRPSALAALVQR